MNQKPDLFKAIHSIVGGALSGGNDYESYTYHDGQTPPSKKEAEKKLAELQADYDSKQYQRDRALAYDPIPEQLDQIYHDMDGWKAKIKAVKDKYPKP